jgi:dUTP pyrophosphatase
MNIKFAKTRPDAKIPTKRQGDGCYDLYVCFDEEFVTIPPHSVKLVPTGLCSTFDSNYRIGFRERGSNTKSALFVMAGQIDSNFTGEIFVALYNGNDIPIEITKNVSEVMKEEDFIRVPYCKAVAQFAVEEVPQVDIEEVDADYIMNLKTERGAGMLGSSNK